MSSDRLRRMASFPSLLLIGLGAAAVFAAGVGIAVLVAGVEGTPQWMRTAALAIAMGLGIACVSATTEWGLDRRSVKRVRRFIDAARFVDAAVELQVYVKQLEKLCGQYDPLTLRWSCTLAHLFLHTGQRMRGLAMLALVIDGQLSVLGPNHPDTHRSMRLVERHTDPGAPVAPVEQWWA